MNRLLEEVLDAYRAGAALPRPGFGDVMAALEAEAGEGLHVMLAGCDPAATAVVAAERDGALALVRAGRMDEAAAGLARGRQALEAAEMTEAGRLALHSAHLAAESYLHYRAGRFGPATDAMREALRTVTVLQAGLGARGGFIEARRVHLAQNLVRVAMRQGDPAEGMRLGAGLLAYLEGDDGAWPVPGMESAIPYRLPAPQAELFFTVVANELAVGLRDLPRAELGPLMAAVARHTVDAGDAADARCAAFPAAHAWLRVKARFAEDRLPEMLGQAVPLLAGGRQGSGPLWDAAVADVLAACAALATEPAEAVHAAITRDLAERRERAAAARAAAAAAG